MQPSFPNHAPAKSKLNMSIGDTCEFADKALFKVATEHNMSARELQEILYAYGSELKPILASEYIATKPLANGFLGVDSQHFSEFTNLRLFHFLRALLGENDVSLAAEQELSLLILEVSELRDELLAKTGINWSDYRETHPLIPQYLL